MSAVCAAEEGMSFSELKTACALTDGNLNRHLKVLQEAGAVDLQKTFVDSKPRTTILLSRKGLARFEEYLGALTEVLKTAKRAIPAEQNRDVLLTMARKVEA
jgi:DNA-binding MarR family transcriptional regulator